MTPHWINPHTGPTPEQLGAYADGELSSAARAQVEAWLRQHPGAADEVEETRRLMRAWRAAPPPEPSPDAWDRAFAGIGAALPGGASVRPTPRRWPLRAVAGLLVTAAAALAGVLLTRPWRAPGPPPVDEPSQVVQRDEEPFPVATAAEVSILSMDARDAGAVVVGAPTLEPMEWAAPADIEVIAVGPDGDAARLEQGRVPMIVSSRMWDEDDP